MSNFKMFLSAMAMVVATGVAAPALAQDQGGRGGGADGFGGFGGRGNFDPTQMRSRMDQMMKEQLGLSDDEWKVIQPKLDKVQQAQRDAGGAGGMGMRGMRGGMRGMRGGFGMQGDQPQSALAKATQELRQVLENQDAKAEDIAGKLKAYRTARDEARKTLAEAQKDLVDVLTPKQEALLVMMGTLE